MEVWHRLPVECIGLARGRDRQNRHFTASQPAGSVYADSGRAHRYGGGADDEEAWGIAGMLHDADYEKWPEDHPNRIVSWLREQGEESIAHAISAHHTGWGVPYESTLDKALIACDELTGFVGACCLVRPDGVHSLTPKSVKKKLKDKSFAAKVERSEINAGIEMLGADLTEHIAFIIHKQDFIRLSARPLDRLLFGGADCCFVAQKKRCKSGHDLLLSLS